MTIIAGYLDANGRISVACDTEWSNGYLRCREATKLFRTGAAVLGFSGASAVQWRSAPPPLDNEDGRTYAARLGLGWHDWAVERRHGRQDQDGTFTVEATMLVAHAGWLGVVGSDGSVTGVVADEPYIAIGSGSAVAMGALYIGHVRRLRPSHTMEGGRIVGDAVAAAIAHAPGCGGDRIVLETVQPPTSGGTLIPEVIRG